MDYGNVAKQGGRVKGGKGPAAAKAAGVPYRMRLFSRAWSETEMTMIRP